MFIRSFFQRVDRSPVSGQDKLEFCLHLPPKLLDRRIQPLVATTLHNQSIDMGVVLLHATLAVARLDGGCGRESLGRPPVHVEKPTHLQLRVDAHVRLMRHPEPIVDQTCRAWALTQ